ncbi:ricin-type beta-trefoil lectin domain protein [Actinoplanes sp. LDG1-06]|uniref:Ricin-type beta-trefoil lectin domain protein n=1 Tax=Paractinoplanes ovalisporus TaxID=2810368 RepID=A0ABS2AHQ6_9ACTN|nr:SGNH/GDSL hydrolase family protein [Actinoplanes ovalisporus]MBM2619338.1 ricin-type beta-trefoil lectin domain protein [Actinoplanes ovalisporus]
MISTRSAIRSLTTAAVALTATAVVQLIGVQHAGAATAAGLNYVAIGSSFAAGPGILPVQSSSGAAGCSRSSLNYPSIVSRQVGANLTDVSCSGATTANVLSTPQGSQPPQVSAVGTATQVVTVTIGGNDVNYLGSLGAYTCQGDGGANCATVDRAAIDKAFGELTGRLQNVVNAVRGRAPSAHIYLVNYFTILPDSGGCAGVPLTADQMTYERSIASRLASATLSAASATQATLVDLAAASRGHDACSADPWVETGHPAAGRSQYHPNEAGMRGAAKVVEAALAASGQLRTAAVRSGIPGKCVDVASSGTADGTPVQLFSCNGSAAQQWTFAPSAGGALRALGKCLDVRNSGTANDTKVQLWTCNGSAAQRWVAGPNTSLINPQSGRCLDDPRSSTSNGTQLGIFDCNGTAAQQWTLAG